MNEKNNTRCEYIGCEKIHFQRINRRKIKNPLKFKHVKAFRETQVDEK